MRATAKVFLAGLAAAVASSVVIQRVRNVRQWLAERRQVGPGTALITGGSAGIGAEFARRLARDGYDLVLVGRRAEKLQAVANEIREENMRRQCPVEVETLVADLDTEAGVALVEKRILEIADLTLLVNNAGFGGGGNFARDNITPELSMVQVHVLATMRLTRAALPGMVARRHGGIINVSSLGAFFPMGGSTTYGATKSFLNHFTEGLHAELQGSGVRVQALCPGFTYSEFHDRLGFDRSRFPAFIWMKAGPVVEESLQGLREGRLIVVPGTVNKLMYCVVTGVPFQLMRRVTGRLRTKPRR